MDCLKHTGEIYHVRDNNKIGVGMNFYYLQDRESKPIRREVTEVIEQRKERGVFEDEDKRGIWGRVKMKVV